jgi:hypothetical protein
MEVKQANPVRTSLRYGNIVRIKLKDGRPHGDSSGWIAWIGPKNRLRTSRALLFEILYIGERMSIYSSVYMRVDF